MPFDMTIMDAAMVCAYFGMIFSGVVIFTEKPIAGRVLHGWAEFRAGRPDIPGRSAKLHLVRMSRDCIARVMPMAWPASGPVWRVASFISRCCG